MRSRLSLFGGHPVHVMIVPFAMAPFPFMAALDVADRAGFEGALVAGGYLAALGVLATAVAILTGLLDLAAIPDEVKAHTTAAIHFSLGVGILLLYGAALYLRLPLGQAPGSLNLLLGLDALGAVAIGIQGWLGGELVVRHHMGVLTEEEGADPVDLSAD